MAGVEKKLFATLAVLELTLLVGQCAQDRSIRAELGRFGKGFDVEESRRIDLVARAARERDEWQAEGEPLVLDRWPRPRLETFAALPASNLPAALLNQRGQPLAIR